MKAFLKRKKDKKHPLENGVKGDSGDDEDEFHDTAEVRIYSCSWTGSQALRRLAQLASEQTQLSLCFLLNCSSSAKLLYIQLVQS